MSNLGKKLPSKLTRPSRAAHPFDHTRVDVTHEQNVPDLQASPSREALLPDCPRDGRPARIAPACLLGFDATDPHLRSTRFSLQKVFWIIIMTCYDQGGRGGRGSFLLLRRRRRWEQHSLLGPGQCMPPRHGPPSRRANARADLRRAALASCVTIGG